MAGLAAAALLLLAPSPPWVSWAALRAAGLRARELERESDCESDAGAAPASVRVASYNTLWQPRATPERYFLARPADLEWGHRLALMRAELERLAPDVYCLQEVELRTAEADFALPGFACVAQRMQKHAVESGHTTGVATFYRRAAFPGGAAWTSSRSRTLAVELLAAAPSPPLYVLNAHLQADPSPDEPRGAARLRQLEKALHGVAQRVEQTGHAPARAALVLCGDFNSPASGAAYRFARDGALPGGTAERGAEVVPPGRRAEHAFELRSAYAETLGHEPHFTYCVGHACAEPPCAIDFIFAGRPALRALHAVLPCGPWEEVAVADRGVPDSLHGSDHLPVCADLEVELVRPGA